MRSSDALVNSLLAILVHAISAATEQLSADDCLALGFRKSDLQCLRCNELSQFDLSELKDSCLKCCQAEATDETAKKYYRAELSVCSWKLGHYPQIREFVRGEKVKAFPNLTVKYQRGADPTLNLFSQDSEEPEEMSIKKWTTDQVEEYLLEHLSA